MNAAIRILGLSLAVAGLGGCLADLYGGNPRLQVENHSARWKLRMVGLGSDSSTRLWSARFDPAVEPGSTSPVVELPVCGTLDLFLALRDSAGRDSVARTSVRVDLGDFEKLRLDEPDEGGVRIR